MKNNLKQVKKFLIENDYFLLSTHINPDGDGIGSILAMGWILSKLNKHYFFLMHDPVPRKLLFLSGAENISSYSKEFQSEFTPKALIPIDCPNLNRLGDILQILPENIKTLNIDHHISNDMFGDVNIIDPDASASTEIVFEIADYLSLKFDKEFAEYIYTGILIDTGRFRFPNTTSKTFSIASRLLEAGARPDFIADWLFHTNTLETILGLSEVLKTMQLFLDGKVATSFFSHSFLSNINLEMMETEGFANHPLSIENVIVSAFLQEREKGTIRVSLRSKESDADMNKVANKFGGGGHPRAAGFVAKGTLDEVNKKLIEELKKAL